MTTSSSEMGTSSRHEIMGLNYKKADLGRTCSMVEQMPQEMVGFPLLEGNDHLSGIL